MLHDCVKGRKNLAKGENPVKNRNGCPSAENVERANSKGKIGNVDLYSIQCILYELTTLYNISFENLNK